MSFSVDFSAKQRGVVKEILFSAWNRNSISKQGQTVHRKKGQGKSKTENVQIDRQANIKKIRQTNKQIARLAEKKYKEIWDISLIQ